MSNYPEWDRQILSDPNDKKYYKCFILHEPYKYED